MPIQGSLVPNITIFDASGALDVAKTRRHMEDRKSVV